MVIRFKRESGRSTSRCGLSRLPPPPSKRPENGLCDLSAPASSAVFHSPDGYCEVCGIAAVRVHATS